MSISEQVKQLKEEAKYLVKDQEKRLASILYQAADTIESLSAKLQAENMERLVGCYTSENTYFVKRSKKKDVIVSIMCNRMDNKYHFVNLTDGHTCSCGFNTIDEAVADMEKQKKEGAIDDFYKMERGGWISCKDRLPEDGVDVLVWFEYFRYGEYNRLFRTKGISYTYNGQWSGFVNGQSGWNQLSIIAWQQMPEDCHEP